MKNIFSKLEDLKIYISCDCGGFINNKCDLCDKAFGFKGPFKHHIKTEHKGVKIHKCHMCGRILSNIVPLRYTNINNVHEGLINHKCNICINCQSFCKKNFSKEPH